MKKCWPSAKIFSSSSKRSSGPIPASARPTPRGHVFTGTFTPSPEARSLTRAPHITQSSTPVTARFSNSTGIPVIPDNDPNANPRGLAIRFNLAARRHTDIISHSADGFPTRTGQEFLEMLKAIATTDLSKPSDPKNPSPIERFLGSHPTALAYVQIPKPAPSSFARETYFGVNAIHFVNEHGETQFGRYRIVPAEGNDFLEAKAPAAKPPTSCSTKLPSGSEGTGEVHDHGPACRPRRRRRRRHHPLAEPTARSSSSGNQLTATVPNDAAEQKQIIFDPIPRVDGIDPSADPLLEPRAAVYLISGRRRRAAGK